MLHLSAWFARRPPARQRDAARDLASENHCADNRETRHQQQQDCNIDSVGGGAGARTRRTPFIPGKAVQRLRNGKFSSLSSARSQATNSSGPRIACWSEVSNAVARSHESTLLNVDRSRRRHSGSARRSADPSAATRRYPTEWASDSTMDACEPLPPRLEGIDL
jgi:hypothetical protein